LIRVFLATLMFVGCSNHGTEPTDAGFTDAGFTDAGFTDAGFPDAGFADAGPSIDFLAVLNDTNDVDGLEGDNGAVKYLAGVEGATPRDPIGEGCAFQNTNSYAFHIDFLRAQPGGEEITFADYANFVLRRSTRLWWGGAVSWRPDDAHPLTGAPGTLLFFLYTEDTPGNRLVIDDVRAVHAELTACAPAFANRLAFVPQSTEQTQTARAIEGELEAEGIAVLVN
jgi:hypothetical protein